MGSYRLHRQQFIPATLAEVWAFFSDASNLERITPAKMKFRVTSLTLPQDIYPGQIITYKVSPLLGIPLFWMTEITSVVEGRLFVDEQRRGPYTLWHHQHLFEEQEGGVLMTDIVHYEPPFYGIGRLANTFFIRRELESIFNHRSSIVAQKWGGPEGRSIGQIARVG